MSDPTRMKMLNYEIIHNFLPELFPEQEMEHRRANLKNGMRYIIIDIPDLEGVGKLTHESPETADRTKRFLKIEKKEYWKEFKFYEYANYHFELYYAYDRITNILYFDFVDLMED